MKKALKIIGIVFLVIIVLIGILVAKILVDYHHRQEDQKQMVKSDEELIGTHLYIDRENGGKVDLNFYAPEVEGKTPLVVNLHGGAFIAGDSDTLDTQSARISKEWGCAVACINYSLAKDGVEIQDAVDEIKDAIKYFIANADEYNIDTENIYVLGYSAGGYHAMASCLQLHNEGITIKGQILCYAFTNDILEQYNALSDEMQKTMPPALIILADDEPIGKSSLDYKTALDENGVQTELITYEGALHGFIEENNPEYEDLYFHDAKSPEQEEMARDAEGKIGEWINKD